MVAGDIVAGPVVRNACRRHLDDLKRSDGICFDPDAAAHAFGFFEEVLKLSEGQFEGQPFHLEPSQAFIIGSLFGWKRADGRRRFRRAYIEQGKGNGKSPVAGGIGLFGMTATGAICEDTYGYPGSETDLLRRGVLSGGALSSLKARVLLTLCIAENASTAAERYQHFMAKI